MIAEKSLAPETTLEALRGELDIVDRELMELLSRRFDICRRVAEYKRVNGVPMMQTDRVRLVKKRASALGESYGIDSEFTQQLYTLIIGEACRIEDRIIDNGTE